MNAVLARDPFMPRPPQGMGRGLALALIAHVLLVAALAFGVNWHTSEPQAVVAELWSAVPQNAAPRATEPPPPPAQRAPERPVVKPPQPVVKPAPDPRPEIDAQIAIEKAARKKELERKAGELEADKQRQREKADKLVKAEKAEKASKAEQSKREAAERKAAADEKAQAAKDAAAREANLKRMRELAGATGGPADTGTALRSSGPSAGYAGRIMARIKPNIVFTDIVDGNPLATVEVKLAPDGTIVGKRLVKSSGVKSWDDAVLRAIDRTEVLPRDTDGRVPPPFQIDFRLRDN